MVATRPYPTLRLDDPTRVYRASRRLRHARDQSPGEYVEPPAAGAAPTPGATLGSPDVPGVGGASPDEADAPETGPT